MGRRTGPEVVRVPGDKSLSHRALIMAALATGTSRVSGILESADVHATAAGLRAMGWDLPPLGPEMAIAGQGFHARVGGPIAEVDCGNSGTTARLLLGVAAAQRFTSDFTGDDSLRQRPMGRVTTPLAAMGAEVQSRGTPDCLPVRITGRTLAPLRHEPAVASAQVKGALLLAGVCGGVRVTVREPARSRDHTERMLRALGAAIDDHDGWLTLQPPATLASFVLRVPGDPSSAAFFVALRTMGDLGELVLPDVLLNPTRTGFLGVLERMGGRVRVERVHESAGERVGDLVVAPAALRGVTVHPHEVPALIDEIPILAVLAARAEGETRVTGAAELRVKESDRIATTVMNLRAVGVEAEELPDGLVVRGGHGPLRGAIVTCGDHRIAMAFGVLAALPGCEIRVDDRACVDVSFPGFWEELDRVGG